MAAICDVPCAHNKPHEYMKACDIMCKSGGYCAPNIDDIAEDNDWVICPLTNYCNEKLMETCCHSKPHLHDNGFDDEMIPTGCEHLFSSQCEPYTEKVIEVNFNKKEEEKHEEPEGVEATPKRMSFVYGD